MLLGTVITLKGNVCNGTIKAVNTVEDAEKYRRQLRAQVERMEYDRLPK
jgi:hypothetical protein